MKKTYYFAWIMLFAWLLLLLWTIAEMCAAWRDQLIIGLVVDLAGIAAMAIIIVRERRKSKQNGQDKQD